MSTIRYIGGVNTAPVKISYSVNNGLSWQEKDLRPGQSLSLASNVTTLLMNNIPYNPRKDYEIRGGKISEK